MPGTEEEAVGVILKFGDVIVESAGKILMLLIQSAQDARERHKNYRAMTGEDGFVKRNAKRAASAALSKVTGLGDKGLVSMSKANPDGTSLSYKIAEGVLTSDDLKKLNREFGMRQLQVHEEHEKGTDDKLGLVEFTVPQDQREQFEAALSRLVPIVGLGGEAVGAEEKVAPAFTLDTAHVTDDRQDLKDMCDQLNKHGIAVAFSRDSEGHVEMCVKPSKGSTYDNFVETLKLSAKAYGLSKSEINPKPIKRTKQGGYPDKFEFQGMQFRRDPDERRAWISHDPEDERTRIKVSIGNDNKPQFEITRNDLLVDSSSKHKDFFYSKEQPLEGAVFASMSSLDRSRRVDERQKTEAMLEKRGKALSGSGLLQSGNESSRTAEIASKAKTVARSAEKDQTHANREQHSAGVRR